MMAKFGAPGVAISQSLSSKCRGSRRGDPSGHLDCPAGGWAGGDSLTKDDIWSRDAQVSSLDARHWTRANRACYCKLNSFLQLSKSHDSCCKGLTTAGICQNSDTRVGWTGQPPDHPRHDNSQHPEFVIATCASYMLNPSKYHIEHV